MRAVLVGCLSLFVAPLVARAQTVETPVPFDSARRVFVITPNLAERLHLTAPAWPVKDEYRDARLYSVTQGGFVLVALLPSGALQRYSLTQERRVALGAAIDDAMATSGRPTAQSGVEVSEPAGNGFAKHMTVLSATIYGATAASLFDDGSAAGAAYVLTAGAGFFISYAAAQNGQITRAQGDLSANLGLAIGGGALSLGYAATGNGDKGVRGTALGAAVLGSILGAGLGQGLTDAEAHAAVVGIEGAAASAWAIAAGSGANNRGMATAVAASEPIGYFVGVHYPRVASYSVTAGDLNAMQTAGMVGALAGASLVSGGHASTRRVGAAVGASYVGGLIVGAVAIARPFDLLTADASLVTTGAFAGGAIGLAVPLILDSRSTPLSLGAAAAGATLGMAVVFGSTDFSRAGGRSADAAHGGMRFRVNAGPAALGLAARSPGRYPILSLEF